MNPLAQLPTPPSPRFNGWRFLVFIVSGLFFLALPVELFFYMDLRESKINLAEVAFLDEREAIRKAFDLKKQVETLRADSARMANKIAILERQQAPTRTTNARGVQLYQIPAFGHKPTDYPSYSAYLAAKLGHYVAHTNKLYQAAGVPHRIR